MKKFLFLLCFFLISCSKQENPPLYHSFKIQLNGQEITLSFDKSGHFFGQVLNNYFGEYTINQNQIKLTLQGSTMKMGLPGQLELENNYFKTLKEINTFELKDKILILKGQNIEYQFHLLDTD